MGASFLRGCLPCPCSAASISMLRCCQSIAAPRPFNGPSPWATPLPATPPCFLKKASTRSRFCCNKPTRSDRNNPQRSCFPAGRRGSAAGCRDSGRTRGWNASASVAESRRRNVRAAAQSRRRPHGLCRTLGDGTLQPLARLSALARRLHRSPWQKADRAPHGNCAREFRLSNSVRPIRVRCALRTIVCSLAAPVTPGWSCWKCSSKARSAWMPPSSCAEIRSRRIRDSVERHACHFSRAQSGFPHSSGCRTRPSRITPTICCGRRGQALSPRGPQSCHDFGAGRAALADLAGRAIRPLLKRPNAGSILKSLIALRLGVFQLWFLDRIPAHAAIDESVELTNSRAIALRPEWSTRFFATTARGTALLRTAAFWRRTVASWQRVRRIPRGWSSAGLQFMAWKRCKRSAAMARASRD